MKKTTFNNKNNKGMNGKQVFKNMTATVHNSKEMSNRTVFNKASVVVDPKSKEIEVMPRKNEWKNNLRIYVKDPIKVMTRKDGSYMLYCALEADCGKNVKELVKSFKEAIKGTEEYEKRLKR